MPIRNTNRLFAVAALAFLAALAPVVVGAWLLHESAIRRDEERLSSLRAEIDRFLEMENQRYVDYLFGIGTECAAGLTDEQWQVRRTTDAWLERFPHLDAIGWIDETQNQAIHFLSQRGAAAVPVARSFANKPEWLAAMQLARTEKRPTDGPTPFPGLSFAEVKVATANPPDDSTLVVFVPIRIHAAGDALAGFALGELRWRPLVEESVTLAAGRTVKADLHDFGAYAFGATGWDKLPPQNPPTGFSSVECDMHWQLLPTPSFYGSEHTQPWLILACGIPLACAVAWVAARQSMRRAALETRVAERTAELRSAHDRLSEALTHERELNAMKTNFISMVTHELRTPLSVVQSSTDILSRYLERLPEEKRTEHFRAISHAVLRITDLSDEVLLFSRFESQRVQLKLAPLSLEPLCAALVHEMLSATNEKCPITLVAEPNLPMAQADERLLRHVLVNLVSNAVKYSGGGAPVTLRLTRQGERAIFAVEDRGMGIAAGEQARLFHSFHRGANVEHLPGTGLGLVIVKRCVELHGGTIALQSEEGRGTTVTVDLPIFTQPKPNPTP